MKSCGRKFQSNHHKAEMLCLLWKYELLFVRPATISESLWFNFFVILGVEFPLSGFYESFSFDDKAVYLCSEASPKS